MVNSQEDASFDQSDGQQSNPTLEPAPTPEPVIFTVEDMATSEYTEDSTGIVTFVLPLTPQNQE